MHAPQDHSLWRTVSRLSTCALLLGCLSACSILFEDAAADGGAPVAEDGQSPASDATNLTGDFGAPELLSALDHPGMNVDDPTLRRDELEIYYNVAMPGAQDGKIYRAEREAGGDFSAGVFLDVGGGEFDNTSPELSWDGLTLYFASNRPGCGIADTLNVWKLTRPTTGGTFGSDAQCISLLSTIFEDIPSTPFLASRQNMVIAQTNTAPTPSTAKLYLAVQTTQGWSINAPLSISPDGERTLSAHVSENGLTIVFDRTSTQATVASDLYITTRESTGELFDAPADNLGMVNSPEVDSDGWLSPNGSTLYFMSRRPDDGDARLWVTRRTAE